MAADLLFSTTLPMVNLPRKVTVHGIYYTCTCIYVVQSIRNYSKFKPQTSNAFGIEQRFEDVHVIALNKVNDIICIIPKRSVLKTHIYPPRRSP